MPAKPVAKRPPTIKLARDAIGQAKAGAQGASRAAIRSWIVKQYPEADTPQLNSVLRKALAKGVETGVFKVGATAQRFKLGPKAPGAKKKAVVKKPVAVATKKAKKASATKKKSSASTKKKATKSKKQKPTKKSSSTKKKRSSKKAK